MACLAAIPKRGRESEIEAKVAPGSWSATHLTSRKIALALRLWRNGFVLPVLKHGPRSLTYVRVLAWQTHGRNESKRLDFSVLHNRPTSIFGERFEWEDIC